MGEISYIIQAFGGIYTRRATAKLLCCQSLSDKTFSKTSSATYFETYKLLPIHSRGIRINISKLIANPQRNSSESFLTLEGPHLEMQQPTQYKDIYDSNLTNKEINRQSIPQRKNSPPLDNTPPLYEFIK